MNADALESVRQRILKELKCPLKDSANSLVFGKGNPNAEIMFIGEAPGEQEDLQGIPFVGAAGRELDKLLRSINLTLDDVYVANILKYRPPQNRNPTDEEIGSHTPYLIEQIKIIKPKIIITLGNFATKFVLGDFKPENMKKIGGITFLHGRAVKKTIDGVEFSVFPVYHPAAILHNPNLRKELEEDFRKIAAFI
ncbi:MAG TPA: uracil-DNA glycosylase [Candidatus Nanoarchaeia archaeon]|nr:uracil-DNA glycosylase [Candidatus Nanoarchaeia archaeon]